MKDEGQTAQLRRLARLLLIVMVSKRRPTIPVLAARLGISERQAHRYLNSLEEAGWKLPPQSGDR